MAAPPICISFIICDRVHNDPGTGKRTLLGTFSSIGARSFPARHPMVGLYAEFTNGHGKTPLTVKFARVVADKVEGELLAQLDAIVDFPDPRSVGNLEGHIANLVFPEPGEYRFSIESAGRLLIERRLVLAKLE